MRRKDVRTFLFANAYAVSEINFVKTVLRDA